MYKYEVKHTVRAALVLFVLSLAFSDSNAQSNFTFGSDNYGRTWTEMRTPGTGLTFGNDNRGNTWTEIHTPNTGMRYRQYDYNTNQYNSNRWNPHYDPYDFLRD